MANIVESLNQIGNGLQNLTASIGDGGMQQAVAQILAPEIAQLTQLQQQMLQGQQQLQQQMLQGQGQLQQQMLQNQQQTQQQLTQLSESQQQTQATLHEVQNVLGEVMWTQKNHPIRGYNKSHPESLRALYKEHSGGDHSLESVPPPLGSTPPAGVPFPGDNDDLMRLTGEQLNQLETFYEVQFGASGNHIGARRNAFSRYITDA
ncbi:hypothetical protein Ndes2526B_g04815 [Nannochloris sp. 'desiccata']|nr:hypothetical protein NADE_003490 [Chlorella desiccata (nom. nud.)]